ncbi:DUF975 family protein [Leuconostoc rapi]|uniref:DUF975 family protein n=1 Tax=Leuconostoc rapi TaxID=1406906 RepID=UPI00195CB566|nr:DUF975 family protein [Leuconostoc rapi]MBM7436052.1 putative membrane protein [Leuconostoc rapi]
MKSVEPISISGVKREARALYHGRFKAAIKINLIPIVTTVLTMLATAILVYSIFTNLSVTSDVSVDNTDSSSTQIYSVLRSILSDAVQLLFLWTSSWTLIDWYENPKATPSLRDSFQIFRRGNVWHTLLLAIVQNMLLFLWTLVFIVPGIIKIFSYSQTYFAYKIDIENHARQPQLTDYITVSRRIMAGRKWELFLLELSFIGWHLLGILTAGVAYIYVVPYLNATRVAYSRHLFTLAMTESVAK